MGAGGAQRGFLPELRPGISKTGTFGVRFRGVSGSFPGRFRGVSGLSFPTWKMALALFQFLPPRSHFSRFSPSFSIFGTVWANFVVFRLLLRFFEELEHVLSFWACLGPKCQTFAPGAEDYGREGREGGRTRVQEAGVGEGRAGVKGGGGGRQGAGWG